MIRGVIGALVVSWAAWLVMRTAGFAGPDASLYNDLLTQAWRAAMGGLRWLLSFPHEPQRVVLVLAAVAGFMAGVKSGK